MRKILLSLIPCMAFPISVNAETIWLVYSAQHSSSARGSVMDKIEMKNEKQCLTEGPKLEFLVKQAKISNSDFKRKLFDDVTWSCIKGK